MLKKALIALLFGLLVSSFALADNASPLSVGRIHYVYQGKYIEPDFNSPGMDMDVEDIYEYLFLVSCRFDTGGVDIGFLIDSSGSMGSQIAAVKSNVATFAESLDAALIDYRLGGCPFADSTLGMFDFDVAAGYQMTDSLELFQERLDHVAAWGGGDGPEEYLDAIAALVRYYEWRLLAMKILIGYTDAPFCEEGDPCGNCHSNENKDSITVELMEDGFILFNMSPSSVYGGGCVPASPYALNWYTSSAESTGGSWFNMSTTSWSVLFDEIVDFIRDYQVINVAMVNTSTDTIYNVEGEFIASDCFLLVEEPGIASVIAPADTHLFTFRLDTLHCPMDSSSDLCFQIIFSSEDASGSPLPDMVTGGCVFFGNDCGCNGTQATKTFPPENIITSCADQCVMYSLDAKCELDTTSFLFKVNRGSGWVMYGWDSEGIYPDGDSGFAWCPPDSTLFFNHGDTVDYEVYSLDDIAGLGLRESPVSHRFLVDLEPPTYADEFPVDGALIGGPPSNVRINITDDLAGIDDTEGMWMSINGVVLPEDYPFLSFDGYTFELSVEDTVAGFFPVGDSVIICVGAQDDPDLCDPNTSQTCWSFMIDYLNFDLPEKTVSPGDTVTIPVIAYNPDRFTLHNFDISINYNPEILDFIGAVTTGSALDGSWSVDYSESLGTVRVTGSGMPPIAPMDTLVRLMAVVPIEAPGASFTTLVYESIELDSGYIGYQIIDNGWVLAEWLPENWTHDLVFDSDSRPDNQVLTFGIMPGASDGYDAGMDVQYIPPPSTRTDAYFPVDDAAYPFVNKLSRDIKSPDPIPVSWHIVTREDAGELSWNTTGLPEGLLTINGIMEMHHHDTYHYAANETIEIVYDRPTPDISNIDLTVGWNLVGFSYLPTVPVVPNVFPGALYEMYGFNTATYSYFGTNRAEAARGYWVYSEEAGTYPLGGVPVATYEFPLSPGWNLIGCTYESSADFTTEPSGLLMGSLYEYSGGAYVAATEIEAGHGYWALATGYGVLRVPASGSSKGRVEADWTSQLNFLGKQFSFGVGPRALSNGIPPVNPNGENKTVGALVYDAYDMKDLIVPDARSWTFQARKNGMVSWNIPGEIELQATVNGRTFPVENGGSYYLAKGDEIVFSERTPLPGEFGVMVRPNPANAAFNVTVDLPEKSEVTISLYDMLGKQVVSLADGEMTAGTHQIHWNAKNQASGIYLVRAEWKNGNAVSKVVLLK